MKIATTIGEVYPWVTNPAEAMEMYVGSGFKYFDFSFYAFVLKENHPFMSDAWRDMILAAKEKADCLGFKFVQAHSPAVHVLSAEDFDRNVEGMVRSIEACSMLGIKNTVIHTGYDGNLRYPDNKKEYFKANRPFLEALIPAMEKHEVSVLLENSCEKNTGGAYFPMTGKDLNDFLDFIGHPLYGACWDTGHGHIQGLDVHDEIVELGSNLKAVHIHDNGANHDSHMLPFAATFDMDSMMRGFIESNFGGFFTFEADGFMKYGGRKDSSPLAHPPKELKKEALKLLYKVGKYTLDSYGIYEE